VIQVIQNSLQISPHVVFPIRDGAPGFHTFRIISGSFDLGQSKTLAKPDV
jgi:hypothetical protein